MHAKLTTYSRESHNISQVEPKQQQQNKTQQRSKRQIAITVTRVKILGNQQKWQCYICNEVLDDTFECDHILSLENGGPDIMSNLCLVHANCHVRKTRYDRNPDLYEQVTGKSKYFGNGPLAKLINKN